MAKNADGFKRFVWNLAPNLVHAANPFGRFARKGTDDRC